MISKLVYEVQQRIYVVTCLIAKKEKITTSGHHTPWLGKDAPEGATYPTVPFTLINIINKLVEKFLLLGLLLVYYY